MKTVGQLISSARQQQDLSIEQLSKKTKIDPKYLVALEADKYHLLPSPTFAKGFIRNASLALGLNPKELVAIFRRDYHSEDTPPLKLIPKQNNFSFVPSLFPFFALALIFLGYLGYQFRAVITPPKLIINQPKKDSVVSSPFVLEGETSNDSTIKINDSLSVRPEVTGKFSVPLNLNQGKQEIKVVSTNRFQKSNVQKITVTVLTQ